MCGRFLIVAFVKLIVTFLNAFALWLKKKKKKKREAIATFLKRNYR